MDQATAGPQTTPTTSQSCGYCRKPFTPRKSWQRFCSKNCRRDHHKAGGASELASKVAELEERVRRLEGIVHP